MIVIATLSLLGCSALAELPGNTTAQANEPAVAGVVSSLMNHYHHDIKAPFAIIDGILSNDIYDRDKQRDIVLAQVERGSKLIATMARILGGHHRRRIQSCALQTLVQDCL